MYRASSLDDESASSSASSSSEVESILVVDRLRAEDGVAWDRVCACARVCVCVWCQKQHPALRT